MEFVMCTVQLKFFFFFALCLHGWKLPVNFISLFGLHNQSCNINIHPHHMKGWHVIISHKDSVAVSIYRVSSPLQAVPVQRAQLTSHLSCSLSWFPPHVSVVSPGQIRCLLPGRIPQHFLSCRNKTMTFPPRQHIVHPELYFRSQDNPKVYRHIDWFNSTIPSTVSRLSAVLSVH